MVQGRSIDFVTKAGRGGQILPLLEAARTDALIADDAPLWRLNEGDRTSSDTEGMLRDAVNDYINDTDEQADTGEPPSAADINRYVYVRDFTDTWVVWRDSGDDETPSGLYQADYQIDDATNAVTIGTPKKVVAKTTYEPAPEQPDTAAAPPTPTPIQEADVADTPTAQELQESNAQLTTQLAEANTAAARAQEQLLIREAGDHVAAAIAKVTSLPALTAKRLVESFADRTPPVTDGNLDVAKLDEAIAGAVQAEVDYLAGITGRPVQGLGGTSRLTEASPAGDTAALEESFKELGLSESAAKTAATGR
jgi:hypothetical protein